MEYVRFGSSGLMVSRMALGMGLREQYDEREVERSPRRLRSDRFDLSLLRVQDAHSAVTDLARHASLASTGNRPLDGGFARNYAVMFLR